MAILERLPHNSEVYVFLPQVSDDEIKAVLEQLNSKPLEDESIQRYDRLKMVLEICNEQYKAIVITTGWIQVRLVDKC